MVKIIINILLLLTLIFVLFFAGKKKLKFTFRVLFAVILGLFLGYIVRLISQNDSDIINQSMIWYNIIGSGYVRLLQMLVMPLVFVSITMAMINIKGDAKLGKITTIIISVLVITTGISALVGFLISKVFDLNALSLEAIVGDISESAHRYEGRLELLNQKPIAQQLLEIIPTNPFHAMAGFASSATLSVVFFSAIIGVCTLSLKKINIESFTFFSKMISSLNDVIMNMVNFVMRLTPYGVLALMAKFMATSDLQAFAQLGQFLLASYIAIFIMMIVHTIILMIFRFNPIKYYKKSFTTLAFAFSSRTSAGTLPMTINTLKDKMGIDEGISNLSASLGVTIGQNGCAGIYPAMVIAMIAPTLGINAFEPEFLIKSIIIIAISSFGIAGVGGGATNAALITLSALNFPVGLVGVLAGIEPLIDMGRTMLNVNDSMIAATTTSKICNAVDMNKFNEDDIDYQENQINKSM